MVRVRVRVRVRVQVRLRVERFIQKFRTRQLSTVAAPARFEDGASTVSRNSFSRWAPSARL